MSDRRRRVVLLFLLGLLTALVVAEASARFAEAAGPPILRWYDAATQLKVEQMDDLDRVDVIFAGTSVAWQGLVPEVFTGTDPEGRTAYNAGLAGGVPVVMEPWLLEEVIPRLHPDLVIWGLSSMDFSTSYGDDNLDRYRDALDSRAGPLAAIEQTTARLSSLVRYRTILRHPGALFGPERDAIETDFADAAAILGADGQRLRFQPDTGPDRARQIEARLVDYRIDESDIQAIHRTVNALRDQGVEVLLVEMPVPDRYVSLHPEGVADTSRAHETITAISDVFDLPTIDLRYGFTDDDFVDFTHLDQTSTTSLTTRLAIALTGSTQQPPTTGELLATANRTINVFDRLYHHLLGGGDTFRSPAYWTSVRHSGKHGDMANAFTSGGFDVVMVGSSLVANGFDPVLFTELDGRSAFNAGLPAVEAERLTIWLDSVLRLSTPDLVVYGVDPRDVRSLNLVDGACTDDVEGWELSELLRTAAFDPVAAFDGLWWENILFGDPVRFEPSAKYRRGFNEFGGRMVFPQSSQQAIERSATNTTRANPMPTCPERFEAIATNVERLKAGGITTVVVFMPMSDLRAGTYKGGREEAAAISSEIEAVVLQAGADVVLDFSHLLPNSQFRDLSHATFKGSLAVTTALAAELAALGL